MFSIQKIIENPYTDLYWNVPETKQGVINVIGGNGQNFRTPVRVAEYLAGHYPLRTVNTVLPDALQGKLPEVEGLIFCKSTETGAFADAAELTGVVQGADFSLIVGDLSRNSVTMKATASASGSSARPLLITRDSVDAVAEYQPGRALMNENLVFFASLPQLQKLLRAVYYPKMLMMSQSLVQVAEILHKFTLSYPCKIVTLQMGQILVAAGGKVVAIPVEKSGYSPLTLWGGELAAKIAALNLYNPGKFIGATVAAVFSK